MVGVTLKPVKSPGAWEKFIADHPESNFLQSWYWGDFHEAISHKVQRTGFYTGNKLVGVMLSIIEDAKRSRYLTIPGGPIIGWRDKGLIKSFVDEAVKIAKENNCVFIRVRPQLEANEFSKKLFSKLVFSDAPMHLHAELTSQLDITKSEEELLANMRKSTRYEVRKAMSLGINITSTDNPSSIRKFYDLQILTAKRQGFTPFSYDYLYQQFKVFSAADKGLLFSAKLKNKLLAQAFIIFYGQEAVYHYGASTEDGRKYPGAYLIQWEAIKEAKKRGLSRYNFWGVSPADNLKHRFYNLSLFKRGFGGTDLEYLHTQDLPLGHKYWLNYVTETIRRKARSL